MPSVLRVAEQRIGRLDRLNSPHEQIEIYWPEDKPAFRLRTDFKLFRTLDAAKAVIGINFDVPIEIKPISAKEAIKLYQTEATKEENWEGIQDAFKAVTDLYRKKDGLITEKEYLYLKGVQASVKCKLSIVRTMQPWIFIATKGSKHYSPKWYFIDCYDVIHTDLTNICYQLTDNLSNIQKKEDTWVSETEARLEKYLEILQINERQSLPNKKNRALEVAEYILKDIIKKETNTSIAKVASSLLTYFKPFKNTEEFSTDFLLFSQQWLNIFQPYLSEKRRNSRNKKKVISLNDLKKDYKGLNISIETLEKILSNIPMKEHTWRSVAACIIGIPDFTPIEPDTPIGEI
jgi:hypothetical protein